MAPPMHTITVSIFFTSQSLWWFEAWFCCQELLSSPSSFARQTTSWYHQLKRRSTPGHTDNPNLIFLILPRLVSSSGFRHKPHPPSFLLLHLSHWDWILSLTLYPHPLFALRSSNLITTLVCWGFSHWLTSSLFIISNSYFQDVCGPALETVLEGIIIFIFIFMITLLSIFYLFHLNKFVVS